MNQETKKGQAVRALQRIKEAEKKANKIIGDARDVMVSKAIEDALAEAERVKEQHLAKARKQAEERKQKIIKEARKEAQKIKKMTEEEIAVLSQKAKEGIPRAVKVVEGKIKRFLEGKTL